MPEEKKLSEREIEILQLVATGLTNREIAQALTISPNTVKVHMSNIFEKTRVASRTELTLYGIEHNIVRVPGSERESVIAAPGWLEVFRKYLWAWVVLFLLFVVFLVVFVINYFSPEPPPADFEALAERWIEMSPMPVRRLGMAVAAYDSHIYVIAGEDTSSVSGSVFRYLPESDAWEGLSDKPTPVVDVSAVLIGEKLYVPGGRDATGKTTAVLEIYDPRLDVWESGLPLPKAVSGYALVDFEGQMFLFGGWDGNTILDDVYVYDPGADSWRAGKPMPGRREYAGAVVFQEKIIILGGRNETGTIRGAITYFPSRDLIDEDPWGEFLELPLNAHGFGTASLSDTIYVIGGIPDEGDTTSGGLAHQFAGDTWQPLTIEGQVGFERTALVPMGARLYVLSSGEMSGQTALWRYQALFYEIFLPIVN